VLHDHQKQARNQRRAIVPIDRAKWWTIATSIATASAIDFSACGTVPHPL
jgi:hypothetical protein